MIYFVDGPLASTSRNQYVTAPYIQIQIEVAPSWMAFANYEYVDVREADDDNYDGIARFVGWDSVPAPREVKRRIAGWREVMRLKHPASESKND
jgi:hypothetical protein